MTNTQNHHRYRHCGLTVRSEIELYLPAALSEHDDDMGIDVDIVLGADTRPGGEQLPDGVVIASHGEGENWWYTATETERGYLLDVARCGRFVIDLDLRRITVHHDPDGAQAHLTPVIAAGMMMAIVQTLRGETVLHASAVAVDGRAIAFVGHSGRGKSTMAALMCVAGAALVTDDVLVVRPEPEPVCLGGASELRLREKAAEIASDRPDSRVRPTVDERTAFAPTAAVDGEVPLAAIVVPSPSRDVDEVTIERLPPPVGLFALLSFPRIYGWRREAEQTRDFARLVRLLDTVPMYSVTIPWGPPFDPGVTAELFDLATTE